MKESPTTIMMRHAAALAQANAYNLGYKTELFGQKNKSFRPSTNRGFHHSDAMKAAEELRMEGKGSHDPVYGNSKKNK